MPNNGNNDADYDVTFSSGTLTQDIVEGVTINQLFMSGGTLVLANPLTLKFGLQFSGGGITSGILNTAGDSTQSVIMVVNGTTINNSGQYDITLTSGNVFSGGSSTFNNSGTLLAHADVGTVSFNMPLNNSGTVSAETGTFSLVSGGTISGTAAAAAGAVLQFGSNFTFSDGAQFAGGGLVRFTNSTVTNLFGTIINNGSILLNATGSFTDFVLNGDVTFSGGGVVSLINADRVRGSGIFTNAGNIIQGETSNSGSLGANEIGLVNQANGIINANVSGLALNVDPNIANGLTNQGLMEASAGGFLLLTGNAGGGFDNTGGTILALDDSQVQLTAGAAITGGTLTTVGTGEIHNLNTATLISLTNAGTFIGNNASSTTLAGTITNTGSMFLNATGSFTDLVLSGDVTLTGGGTITLINADRVRGSGILTNVNNVIEGETSNSGSLGANEIGIVNQAGGLIDANVAGLFLTVDPNTASNLTNLGTMQASGGGFLRLTGNGAGTFNNSGGLIQALDASEVQLTAGATINGGTLLTFGSGVIRNIGTATLDSVTNAGAFIANNASVTTFAGTINNTGTILINSTGSFTDLFINGDVTLTGGSTLTLVNAARIRGIGTLFNGGTDGSAFTIEGETSNSGSLGTNELAIVNRSGGLINANVAGLFLLVDPNVTSGLTNTGIMQASGGGLLRLTGNGAGDFNNAGGLIQALDGSEVQLTAGAIINGGTLTSVGSGVIRNLGSATLNGVTNSGAFIADNASSTTFAGTINNTGTILINSTGSFTDLFINGDVTLTGGSTLTLVNAARIRGIGTLFNGGADGSAFTIEGETSNSGSLGTNELAIVNRSGGLIDANVFNGTSGLALVVDPRATDGLLNLGVMRASGGGILLLTGNGSGSFDNTGGVIEALDGSQVQLTASAILTGGTLSTTGSGIFRNLNTATLNSLTIAGAFNADNASSTTIIGTITNTGSISINSTGSFTDLTISGNVSLTGGGTLNLFNADRVSGVGILTNVNNLIQGETSNSGSIGNNGMGFVNQVAGVVDANVAGLALRFDPSATDGLINQGLMRASGGGILFLTGSGFGGFTNTGGTISALNGSEVQLTNGASITGGTLSTVGTGVFRNLDTATLSSLTNAGAFIGNNASTTTLNGTIVNSGSISINSAGSFTNLSLGSNVTLTGGGFLNLLSADLVVGSGILTNTNNTIQGETNNSGSFGANAIGIVNQAGGIISANISGLTLNVDPNLANGLLNQGTMQAVSGGILLLNGNGGGALTNSGTIKATGGTLQFTGAVTSSGTVDVGADSLSVTGSGSYTQSAGTFRLAGGSVTSSSALVFNGGLVDARGTINAAINNSANLQPALGGTGLSVTGAVTLLSASRLTFQLGGLAQGSQYGFLNANGSVALDGNLVVSFVNAFQAGNSDNFTVLNSTASLSGAFANVASGGRLTTTDNSGSFLVTYNGSTVVLSDFQLTGLDAPVSNARKTTGSAIRNRSPGAEPQEEPLTTTPGAPGPAVSSSAPDHSNPSANHSDASPPTTGVTTSVATRSRSGRTAATNGRGRVVSITLENTDQLLGVLEGPGAATAQGKVTINANGIARKTAPRQGSEGLTPHQPKDSLNRRPARDRDATDRAID